MLSTWRWRAPHQHAARAMPFDPPSSCAVATAIVPTLHRRKPRCREGRLARGRTATGRACSCPRTSGVRFFFTFVLSTRGVACPFPRRHSRVEGRPGSSPPKARLASADRHEIPFSGVPLSLCSLSLGVFWTCVRPLWRIPWSARGFHGGGREGRAHSQACHS